MSRRATLEPLRMTDRALWVAVWNLLALIDWNSPSYDCTKVGQYAEELRQVLLELKKRGTQLDLFPPAA